MSLESEIYSRLSGYSGLSALVSTRIYPVRPPQNAVMPCVSFMKVSADRASNFGVDAGKVRYRVQIDCWSDQMPGQSGGANTVAAQVTAAFKRYSGGNIVDVYLENEQDDYDDQSNVYRVILDFIVWFTGA